MSSTIQLALILCVIVVLIVDVLNIIKNDKLKKQINVCSELHKQILAILVEQEDVISGELDVLYDDLWNNKIDKLMMQFEDICKDKDMKLCSYHDQFFNAYREFQSETAAKIKHIKRKQAAMNEKMKDTLEIKYKGD